ncbi:amidinotransferase [Dysgonomonas sp. Marseille-P4677]|uniref:dimethylarginine dimethylaminohydrolase family protein n=1 Tax=Dysgonomonas sp. Marseille-P4677 TaxID=2364790 RepID=UPI00191474C5|nr:arginine deiminase-related protein [Dysgonomonas sp. Marseille-P4677]MBK5721921.1 amidinotransferase [Dysgonomonas sp. Marseille-P4677]
MILNIQNETACLKTVVLGQPYSLGKAPTLDETYDAKSYESVQKGNYPTEENIALEMSAFEKVLLKYDVEVLRPLILPNCNQVYARDVAFVINDMIITSNIIPDRADEQEAYAPIYNNIAFNKIYNLPEKAHVEGGDIVLYNDTIFVGTYMENDYPEYKTARTNAYAISFLKELFPEKEFIALELEKNDTNPRKGILHLDCTFMPVGEGKAIIYKNGFRNEKDYKYLVDFFGKKNIFEITQEEMYYMNTNVFSISPKVVVSEKHFKRLNCHMSDEWGLTVESIPYFEVSKMGGLLRCSTLPLVRQ